MRRFSAGRARSQPGFSSGARPLLVRALPRAGASRAAGPPRVSRRGGCGDGDEGLRAAGRRPEERRRSQAPLLTMAGNRGHRPRCQRPGWSSRRRGGGSVLRTPGREGVGGAGGHFGDGYRSGNPGAAILEMGRGRLLCLVPVATLGASGGKLYQGASLAQSLSPCTWNKRHKFSQPQESSLSKIKG